MWTRREFLKAAGLSVAAAAVGPALAGWGAGRSDDPIIIGHQADLTGGISSWGFWHDIAARKAVELVNKLGGIAGRPVKLVTEDSQTDPPVGARKFRRLVEAEGAHFIIGSVHSGVNIATNPVAFELKTPYFPTGMAHNILDDAANRYVFKTTTQVRTQVEAAAAFAVDNLGKKWTFCVADYSWGHSHRTEMKRRIEKLGAREVAYLPIPQGTKDFIPYLRRIPRETDVVYFVFFGADTVGFLTQYAELKLRHKLLGPICSLEAIDTTRMANVLEGAWFIEYFPRQLSAYDTPHNRMFRDQIGVDEWAKQKGGDRVAAYSHCYGVWEAVFAIKYGVEKSGWKNPKDHPAFIEALEGARFRLSDQFPQGDKYIRAEDHQVISDHWLSRIENGLPVVKMRIPKEKVAFAPPINMKTLPF